MFNFKRGLNLEGLVFGDDPPELAPLDSLSRKVLARSVKTAYLKLAEGVKRQNERMTYLSAVALVAALDTAQGLLDATAQVKDEAEQQKVTKPRLRRKQ